MTGMTEGWYRDPAPPNRDQPTTLRFWNGQEWTARTRPASKSQRNDWIREDAVKRYEADVAAREHALATGVQLQAPPGTVFVVPRDYTPDGQVLAGWWSRAGALLVDWLLTTVITVLAGWTQLHHVFDVYRTFINTYVAAAQAGATTPPDASGLMSQVAGPLLTFGLIAWLVKLVYSVGFLKAFGSTPGMMMLGLEVRLRDRPGPLSWVTVLVRWLVQNLGTLAGVIPFVGLVSWVFWLLNYLWPLWDPKRQALHDKAARTNVVRRAS